MISLESAALQLVNDHRLEDAFALIRYAYRIGEPVVDDAVYDNFERSFRKTHPQSEFSRQTYDDDPVPYRLLDEFGIMPVTFNSESDYSDMVQVLNDDKSLSMSSVTRVEDAWPYFQMLRLNKLDFMASLKTDGVNTKMLYYKGDLLISLSRGRGAATSLDYMTGSSKIMPKSISDTHGIEKLRITGESYVDKDKLQYLRDKYDVNRYKTSKSSAISMLRTEHQAEDYKYLHTAVFAADGLENTLDKMFNHLVLEGFEVVPHELHSWTEIPDNFDEFKSWLVTNVMTPIAKKGEGMPSDGCAIEVNDLLWVGEQHDQYSNRQLALKFGYWAFKVYKGVITDIKTEQKRVYKSVRVRIEPISTDDDCKAEYINSFNPRILIDNDLYEGKEVYFEKNAGAVNILIHGDRLEKLRKEGIIID